MNVGPEGTLTLSVGRLAVEKGHDTLIRAWRHVVDELPDAKLAIAGLGEQPPLKKIIEEFSLQQHIHLLGFRDDVPMLYNEADLAVLTPVAGESFGNRSLGSVRVGPGLRGNGRRWSERFGAEWNNWFLAEAARRSRNRKRNCEMSERPRTA